ncbi:hypothetical protein [Halosimplex pelagicum]|uniref:Uncharacterized protein n=1 Tax=Halosimplex pelagicum TaxID=869886 RepID=A0A7D5PFV1_9EURY|nr:hypothetical protein [Halosimplex pelagicum]QLH83760.1 hypothetical protein HZS54_19945 [Halosimplex pelagicum]
MSGKNAQSPPTALWDIQKHDRRKLLVLGVILGLLAVRVNELLNWAWDAKGVGYRTVEVATSGEIAVAIVAAAGLVTGWLVLFMFDRTKRFQKVFIVFIATVYVIWNVVVAGHWVENYPLLEDWYVAVVTFLAGIGSGFVPQLRAGKRQGEYPIAASGLFLFVAIPSVVGFFDLYWFGDASLSIVSESTRFLSPTVPIAVLVDATVVSVFLAAVGKFILYSDVRSVTFITSDDEAVMATLIGLFHHVEDDYRGRGPEWLEDGYGDLQSGQAPSSNLHSGQETNFVYLPPGLFPQWVTVSASSISLNELKDDELKTAASKVNYGLVNDFKELVYGSLVPRFIERNIRPNTESQAANVVNADVLVYVTTDRTTIDRFQEVCDHIPDHTDKVVVAAGGTHVTDFGSLPLGFDIIEVDWTNRSTDDDLLVAGIDELREHLDN